MISLSITEVKSFMAKLLTNTTFDEYLLKELDLQSFTGFKITGQLNEAFFSKEELEERRDKTCVLWSEVRQVVYAMIKGSKTPLTFKIIFQLPTDQCEVLIHRLGGKLSIENVGGLFFNIIFDKGELRIITGTAIKVFTLDKTLEQEWDEQVKLILKEQGIGFLLAL